MERVEEGLEMGWAAEVGEVRLEDDFFENKSRSEGRELRRVHWELGEEGDVGAELESDFNGGKERRL